MCSVNIVRLTNEQIRRATGSARNDVFVSADDDELPVDHASDDESDHESVIDYESDDADHNNNRPLQSDVSMSQEFTQFIGRDETAWRNIPYFRRSILHGKYRHSFDKVNCRPGQRIETPKQAFDCFISSEVINIIVKYTNIEAKRSNQNWREIDAIELKAFIGLLLAAGVDRNSKKNIRRFYDVLRGHTLFRATLNVNRLTEILRFIRFDDKTTRSTRRERDKLAYQIHFQSNK